MASIVDVAKRAGVSVATVSRVLSNSTHPVSDKTRNLVLEAAQELNYSPSAVARALVTQETHIIGVIVGDAADPYFATITRGISDIAYEHGYLTIICNSDRIPDIEYHFVRLLRDYRVDGIIFAGGGLTDETYLKNINEVLTSLRSHGVPIVALGRHLFDAPEVNIDNKQATKDITQHLIDLGHRRIAYIAGPRGLTTSSIRLNGYKEALAESGLGFTQGLVLESDFTYESGQRAAEAILEMEPLPTAIMGANDLVAIGCLTFIKQQGLCIPDEISVVGFDNVTATHYVDPPLTTVHVPMREMGVLGTKSLLRAMGSEDGIETVPILPHEVIVRASTAPPPAA